MDRKDTDKTSIVQFNVVNTTPSAITVDLFNLATLNTTPTTLNYTFPPNTVYSSISLSFVPRYIVSNNGFIYVINSTSVFVYDINNSLISTTVLGVNLQSITYNSNLNTVYITDNTNKIIYVLDCFSNTLLTTIAYPNPLITFGNSSFNSTNNSVYLIESSTNQIRIISCVSNSFTATITGVITSSVSVLEFNQNQNVFYLCSTLTTIQIINCNSNTITGTIPLTGNTVSFNYLNNNLYVSDNVNTIYIYNVVTNNLLGTIVIPIVTGLSGFSAFDYDNNFIYFGSQSTGDVYLVNCNNNTYYGSITIGGLAIVLPEYNAQTKSIIFYKPPTGFIFITTNGIASTPYYVTGASNYNFFVQNLQNEPVIVSKIRTISPQTQLDNVATIFTTDSSGNTSQYAVTPINSVSAYQEQGNISELEFDELIFDGRTFISQYVINANTTVILELHYIQLDNTKIKYLRDRFFPKKTPLKDVFDEYVDLSI